MKIGKGLIQLETKYVEDVGSYIYLKAVEIRIKIHVGKSDLLVFEEALKKRRKKQ